MAQRDVVISLYSDKRLDQLMGERGHWRYRHGQAFLARHYLRQEAKDKMIKAQETYAIMVEGKDSDQIGLMTVKNKGSSFDKGTEGLNKFTGTTNMKNVSPYEDFLADNFHKDYLKYGTSC